MICITMMLFSFLIICLAAAFKASSSSPKILDKMLGCNQEGLHSCIIGNCSDVQKVPNIEAPSDLLLDPVEIKTRMDNQELVPVVTVVWEMQADASIYTIIGSKLMIVDENTNQSLCVQFSYSFKNTLNPNRKRWRFSSDVVVEPQHSYTVTAFHLPEPQTDKSQKSAALITVPGCKDEKMKAAQACQENGSLWQPKISAALMDDKTSVLVTFDTAQYSEKYRVLVQNDDLSSSKTLSKGNMTSLNVTFEGSCLLSECEVLVLIQPFFIRCKNKCESAEKTFNLCHKKPLKPLIMLMCVGLLLVGTCFLLWKASQKGPLVTPPSAAKKHPEVFHVQQRKRILIIHSVDHPLYKNVVLKFCAFLTTKCGTEVILDLLDSTRLGVLGSIQWLDCYIKQIENSSDKILILCSRGVQAKWRAMCGDKQVFLREDVHSPMGDLLTPSLSLLVPHFVHSHSFEKYIVAYFDGISSEEDIPSPFNITVRYKLMKQFEEVFFRILNTEKHEPGQMKQIDGLSEDTYRQCPSGRALHDAVEAFRAHQLQHPQWFEDELLENSDDNETIDKTHINPQIFKNHLIYCVHGSTQAVSHVETKEDDFSVKKTELQLVEAHR